MKKNLKGYYEYFLSENKENISHYQKGFAGQIAEYLFKNIEARISDEKGSLDYLKKLKKELLNNDEVLKKTNILRLVLFLNKVLYPFTAKNKIKMTGYQKQDMDLPLCLANLYQDEDYYLNNCFSLYNELANRCISFPEKKTADEIINGIVKKIAVDYSLNLNQVIYYISRELSGNDLKTHKKIYTETIEELRFCLSSESPDLQGTFLILNNFRNQYAIPEHLQAIYNFYLSFLDELMFCFSFLEGYNQKYFNSDLFIRHIANYLFEEITGKLDLNESFTERLRSTLKPTGKNPSFIMASSVISELLELDYNIDDKNYIEFMSKKLASLIVD